MKSNASLSGKDFRCSYCHVWSVTMQVFDYFGVSFHLCSRCVEDANRSVAVIEEIMFNRFGEVEVE